MLSLRLKSEEVTYEGEGYNPMISKEMIMKEFPEQRRWRGHWIWPRNCVPETNSYYFFRKEFRLFDADEDFKLYITAESKYRLYVNGLLVGDGAPMSQPYHKYYDIRDISSCLRAGSNCIAVLVHYNSSVPEFRGGLLAELLDSSGEVVTTTDKGWKAVKAEAWDSRTYRFNMNMNYPYQEVCDLTQFPYGWDMPGFDAGSWYPVEILTAYGSDQVNAVLPWTYLVPRDIPYMRETYLLPKYIHSVEECLAIANRTRSEDLSICLSAPGQPLKHSFVKDEKNLLTDTGITLVKNSTSHMDGEFDGIYDPCIILDFGKVITAYIELELEGIERGIVDIGYVERFIDGYFNNAIEGNFADRVIMKEGKMTIRTFAWRGFRYIKLRFGYCFSEVKLHSVKALVTTYPFDEKGSFISSDANTNAIFEMCRNTITLCSNEFLMDTPWREQVQWSGDVSAVTLGGIYACFGDTRLASKFLKQSGMCQHPSGLLDNKTNVLSYNWQKVIPDYSLWWVMALWKHYMYTGDVYWIHHFYPHTVKILQTILQYIGINGLVTDMPYWVFIDWAHTEKRGECTAFNAVVYGVLETVAKMAVLKKDEYIETIVTEAMKRIKDNFIRMLFDDQKGCFADANIDNRLSGMVSEQANMAAIFWGLCDQETAEGVIDRFYISKTVKYTEAQPFFSMVVLKALEKAGRFDLAMKLLEERWGGRMVARGATSCYEEWTINGSWRSGEFRGFLRTISHAWSAYPAEFLTSNLIGLEIIDPGGKKIRLSPQKTGFDYEVCYPVCDGIIRVSCKGGNVKIDLPAGVTMD